MEKKSIDKFYEYIELLIEMFGDRPNIGLQFFNGDTSGYPDDAVLLKSNGKSKYFDRTSVYYMYQEHTNAV